MTYLKELKKECIRLDRAVKEEEYKLKCIREDEILHIKKGIELNLIEIQLQNINNNKIIEHAKDQAWYAFTQETDSKTAKKIKSVYNKWSKELSRMLRIQEKHIKNIKKNQKEYIHNYNITLRERDYDVESSLWKYITLRNEAYDIWYTEKRLKDIAKANQNREKVISKSRMESNMEDVCGICLETHVTKDTVVTDCKHQFGEPCFQRWRQCCSSTERSVSCPMCKKNNPKIFTFRTRA